MASLTCKFGSNTGTFTLNYSASYDKATNKTTVTFSASSFSYYGKNGWLCNHKATASVYVDGSRTSSGSCDFTGSGTTNGGTKYFPCNPSVGTIVVSHGTSSSTKNITIKLDPCWIYTCVGSTQEYMYGYDTLSVDVTTGTQGTYVLTTYSGTGSSLGVNRTSSPWGGSTGYISHGTTLFYGDVLQITFGVSTGYTLTTYTVNGAAFASGNSFSVSDNVNVVSGAAVNSYLLAKSVGTGSTMSVHRISSAYAGASSGELQTNSVVYYGDVLQVYFGTVDGYTLTSATVNGSPFASGNTFTVASAVTVATSATVNAYSLTISAGAGITLSVVRTSSPLAGAATGALSSGDTVYYNDVLKITYSANSGYAIETATLNGTAFNSGASHTVSAAVSVSVTAKLMGAIQIDDGSSFGMYLVYIDNGSSWEQLVPYIDDGTAFGVLS